MRLYEDRLGKYLIGNVLDPYAHVETGAELLPDSLKADLCVEPHGPLPEDLPGAGLLSRLVGSRLAVIEPYSSAPNSEELSSAMAKLYLGLRQAHRHRDKGSKAPNPRVCLVVIASRDCKVALRETLDGPGRIVEPGVYRWHELHPVYLVRGDQVEERADTLLFRLLVQGQVRKEALLEIFSRQLEPYATLLREFDRRLEAMVTDKQLVLDEESLEDIRDMLKNTHEVLRELGRKEGLRDAVLRIVQCRWPELQAQAEGLLAPAEAEATLESVLDRLLVADSADQAHAVLQDQGKASR